jgi:hypothetical protein
MRESPLPLHALPPDRRREGVHAPALPCIGGAYGIGSTVEPPVWIACMDRRWGKDGAAEGNRLPQRGGNGTQP